MNEQSASQYRTLLIDLDGVIRRWPKRERDIEVQCGLPEGEIQAVAFDRPLLRSVVTGVITHEAWLNEVAKRMQERHPKSAASEAVVRWSLCAGDVDPGVSKLVATCAKTMQVVLVSNATSKLSRDLDTLGISGLVHVVVNSSDIGYAKPDAEFFRTALEKASTQAPYSLFVDDSPENVEGAEALGIRSHRFVSLSEFEKFLRENKAVF